MTGAGLPPCVADRSPYTYDANGRELTRTNRNGEALTRTYDSAGRLATLSGAGVDRTFVYDALGRRLEGRAGAHVDERTYDETGVRSCHVYGTDSAGHADATWAMANDAAGRLVDLVGPTVSGNTAMNVVHTYDDRGRLAGVFDNGLGQFNMLYDAASRMSELQRPNGANTTYAYDDSDRLAGISTKDAVDTLVHEILTTYDDRGIPATQTDQEGEHVYEHDVRGRLTGVDHPAGAEFGDESYVYDTAERRTASHRDAAAEVVYDDGDRLLQDATYTYGYDDEGRRVSRTNRSSGAVTAYTYDVLDHLTGLSEDGTDWSFVYDAQDLRVLVSASGATSYGEAFVYDLNGTVRATYDLAGNRTASYLAGFGFGEVLARVGPVDDEAFALRDRLGTTVGWLDDVGAVADLTVRDAYGVRGATGGVVPFGYTGHAEDPTALVWGRARMLSVRSGMWFSEDSVFTESRCSYVAGSPMAFRDPTGGTAVAEHAIVRLGRKVARGGIGCILGAMGTSVTWTVGYWVGSAQEHGFQNPTPGVAGPDWQRGHDAIFKNGIPSAAAAGCAAGAVIGINVYISIDANFMLFKASLAGAFAAGFTSGLINTW